MKRFFFLFVILACVCLSQAAHARSTDWKQCRFPDLVSLSSFSGPLSDFFGLPSDPFVDSPRGRRLRTCIYTMIANGESARFEKEFNIYDFSNRIHHITNSDYDESYQKNSNGTFVMRASCAAHACADARLHIYFDKSGEMQAVAIQIGQLVSTAEAQRRPGLPMETIAFVRQPYSNGNLIQFIQMTSKNEIDNLSANGFRTYFNQMMVFDADSTDFSHHIDVPTKVSTSP